MAAITPIHPPTMSEIALILSGASDGEFYRTPEVQQSYKEHFKSHVSKYASTADCIKVDELHFPSVIGENGLIRAVPVHEIQRGQQIENLKWTLCLNRFPYATAEGIVHYVLWSLGSDAMDPIEVENYLETRFAGKQRLWYINEPQYQTVPDLQHAHVFVANAPWVKTTTTTTKTTTIGTLFVSKKVTHIEYAKKQLYCRSE